MVVLKTVVNRHKQCVLNMSRLTIQTVVLYSTGKVMNHNLATSNYVLSYGYT